MNKRKKTLLYKLERSRAFGTLITLIIAFFLGALILILNKHDPLSTYVKMFNAVFGSVNGIMQALVKAQPLLFCGLAVCVANRAGILNIGATGQMYIGALCGLLAGVYLKGLPPVIHIPLTFIAAMIGGALWALPTILIKIKTGTSEVITALMLSYVSQLFVGYMVNYPLRDNNSQAAQSVAVLDSAKLPKLLLPYQISIGIYVGIVLAIILHFILRNTKLGFQMHMSGANREAAAAAGVPSTRIMIITILISGAIAGLAGIVEVTGTHMKLIQGFAGDNGLEGIAVSVMGGSPIMIIFSALFFGFLKAGISALNYTTNLSTHFVGVIQGIVIMFIAAPSLFKQIVDRISRTDRIISERKQRRRDLSNGDS